MRLIVAVLFSLFCLTVQAEEVYRWVDEKGRVHYGDTTKRPAERIRVQPDSGTSIDPETLKNAEARAAECQRKRAQLEGYRKASAIKETDALGRTREYTEEERQALLARTQSEVDQLCEGRPAQAAAAAPEPAEEPGPSDDNYEAPAEEFE